MELSFTQDVALCWIIKGFQPCQFVISFGLLSRN